MNRYRVLLMGLVAFGLLQASSRAELAFPVHAKKVLFLGDSITHAGGYIAWIETQLRLQGVNPPEFYNLGLSSETCSGLSEPDHPFPRPDVHERLDRALQKVQPDVVVACYGMNDGIYHPFSQERFLGYQNGVNRLIEKVHNANAKLVLMTPPPFDPLPLKSKNKLKPLGEAKYAYFAVYENYDDVLAKYGAWVMQQKDRVEMVIDLHGPINEALKERRKTQPDYTFAKDGVHPNADGHQILGETIVKAWGFESSAEPPAKLLQLVQKKTQIRHDAWLSEVGHKRPGVKAGLPIEKAEQQIEELNQEIASLAETARTPQTSETETPSGTVYQISYPATAQGDALKLAVDYDLWVPGGVKTLRGVIVHQHGCGPGASLGGRTAAYDLHWQALARKWDCALMGSSYEPRKGVNCRLWCDARNGSGEKFLEALEGFANTTGNGELNSVPWCLWGHSGGGFWASLMQTNHPERIVAIWLRSGTAFGYWTSGEIPAPEISPAVYGVPVMGNPGFKEKGHERFHKAWDGLTAMQSAYQAQGAFFEFAPDPNTGHECGNSRALAIPFFDFWLKHRLPDVGGTTLQSKDAGAKAWESEMADKMAEYIKTGAVTDTTPPPAPENLRVEKLPQGGYHLSWNANADFESGIRGFQIERDGKELSQLPKNPRTTYGQTLLQQLSYHDTPNIAVPKFEFVDDEVSKTPPSYSLRTINGAGLSSKPTTAK